MTTSRSNIDQTLADMRSAIEKGKYSLIPRKKNMDTIARLGITIDEAIDEIYTLTHRDYVSGPCIDRDYPMSDYLWIFRKNVFSNAIYIKFKVTYQNNGSVRIVSFHVENEL